MSDELSLTQQATKVSASVQHRIAETLATAFLCGVLVLTSAQGSEIELWYGNTGRAEQAILALCDSFNTQQENHRIECVGHGSYEATLQKTVSAFRASKHPALVQVLDVGTAVMVASNAFVPVHKLRVAEKPVINEQSFVGSTLDYYRSTDGHAMSVPFSTSTLVLYVNDEKLRSAGIALAPTTWEDFEATLVALKAAGNDCPWTFRLHPWYHLEQFSAVHGIYIASHQNGLDDLSAEYSFAAGAHKRMMRDIKRWYDEGLAVLQENLAIANGARAFGVGECAMLLESTGVYSAISEAANKRFKMSVHPIPVYAGTLRNNSLVGGASLWVLQGFSEFQYEAVAAFFEFILTAESQAKMTQRTGFLPLTIEAYAKIEADRDADSELQQLLSVARSSLEGTATGRPMGVRLGFYAQFRRIWTEELQKAFSGRISVDEALLSAERRGNRLLRRFERMHADGIG